MRHYLVLLAGLGTGLLVGCGPPPGTSLGLERARTLHAEVHGDSLIMASAPLAVARADSQLNEAQRQWQELGKPDAADHHAYLAERYLMIAAQQADLGIAQQELEQAGAERKEVLLAVSEQDAVRANLASAASRLEADAADLRARALADRVRELEAQQTERGLVLTLSDVLFEVDKAQLGAGGNRAVDQLAAFLREYPERKVLIEGHTDDTGSEAHNLDLSTRRAGAVQAALVRSGIGAERTRTVGYGEAYPVVANDTAGGRQQNRRVEVIISDAEGHIVER